MAANVTYFTVSSSSTISLTSDVTTDGLFVGGKSGVFIQPIESSGLDGSPTWTVRASVEDDNSDTVVYDDLYGKNLGVNESYNSTAFIKVNYFFIDVEVNNNTSGSIKFAMIHD